MAMPATVMIHLDFMSLLLEKSSVPKTPIPRNAGRAQNPADGTTMKAMTLVDYPTLSIRHYFRNVPR